MSGKNPIRIKMSGKKSVAEKKSSLLSNRKRPRGNTLLEICTSDIRISAGYQRCNKRISKEN